MGKNVEELEETIKMIEESLKSAIDNGRPYWMIKSMNNDLKRLKSFKRDYYRSLMIGKSY